VGDRSTLVPCATPPPPAKTSSGGPSLASWVCGYSAPASPRACQEALAHAAGISTYTYQKFEKGESRPGTPMNPRLRTLIALATALDMWVEELVGGMSE